MLITAAGCLVATVVLGLVLPTPTAPELWLRDELTGELGEEPALVRLLLLPSEAVILLPAVLVIAACCAWQRRWLDATLVLTAPALAVAINTWVLKPAFAGISGERAYPSGHTVSIVAVALVLVVIAREGTARWVSATVGVLLTVGAGVGMTVRGYHHPAELIGGALFAFAVVLALRATACSPRRHRRPEPAP